MTEIARKKAAEALQRAFPTLRVDFTDQWFDKVVDIVLNSYKDWTLPEDR